MRGFYRESKECIVFPIIYNFSVNTNAVGFVTSIRLFKLPLNASRQMVEKVKSAASSTL